MSKRNKLRAQRRSQLEAEHGPLTPSFDAGGFDVQDGADDFPTQDAYNEAHLADFTPFTGELTSTQAGIWAQLKGQFFGAKLGYRASKGGALYYYGIMDGIPFAGPMPA